MPNIVGRMLGSTSKFIRQAGKEIYRGNIEPYTPKKWAWRRIYRKAHQLRPTHMRYARKVPEKTLQNWWERRWGRGKYTGRSPDLSMSGQRIVDILTTPVKRNKFGEPVSGWGYSKKEAWKVAALVERKKGIPGSYAPKPKFEGYRSIYFWRGKEGGFPVRPDSTYRITSKVRSGYPEWIPVGRGYDPSYIATRRLMGYKKYRPKKFSRKQYYKLRQLVGSDPLERHPRIGTISSRVRSVPHSLKQDSRGWFVLGENKQVLSGPYKYKEEALRRFVNIRPAPYASTRIRAIKEAEEHFRNVEIPAYKFGAVGLLGTTGTGIVLNELRRKKKAEVERAKYLKENLKRFMMSRTIQPLARRA